MTFVTHLPGYKQYDALKDSAFRMGLYIAGCLFATFATWVVVANRFIWFEHFALERNAVAISVMVLFALLPILRFRRKPGRVLVSGLVAWSIFSFLYRLLCLFFEGLASWHGAWQVFMVGVVLYLFAATLAWVVGLVFRVRAAHAGPRENHQLT
ncbi:MAG: hypothetical protein NVS9B14_10030 [Candidatus Acidiferrum sp.]